MKHNEWVTAMGRMIHKHNKHTNYGGWVFLRDGIFMREHRTDTLHIDDCIEVDPKTLEPVTPHPVWNQNIR